jgi:hypothetical protein
VKLGIVVALVACSHDPPARAPITNAAAANDAAPPCDIYFDLARRAVACTSLEQRARDTIQHDVDDMTTEVAERGDPRLVDEHCIDLADRITKLAEDPCG